MPWVTTAYICAATVVMPMYGKMSDRVGPKRTFLVEESQEVKEGDLVVVLEAMKMDAHKAGTVKGLTAEAGACVTSGAAICEIKD